MMSHIRGGGVPETRTRGSGGGKSQGRARGSLDMMRAPISFLGIPLCVALILLGVAPPLGTSLAQEPPVPRCDLRRRSCLRSRQCVFDFSADTCGPAITPCAAVQLRKMKRGPKKKKLRRSRRLARAQRACDGTPGCEWRAARSTCEDTISAEENGDAQIPRGTQWYAAVGLVESASEDLSPPPPPPPPPSNSNANAPPPPPSLRPRPRRARPAPPRSATPRARGAASPRATTRASAPACWPSSGV